MYSGRVENKNDGFRIFLLVTIFIGLSAAAVLFHSLPWGIGVSPDSVAYLKSGSRFASDLDFKHLPSHWPPAYPLFLALMNSLISRVTMAALFGQVLLFALNTIAFIFVVYRCLRVQGKSQYWIATLAGVAFACNPSVLLVHQYAVSEALFIFFLLSSLGACFWFLQGGKAYQLLVAALLVGCIPVTRYAGLPFLPIFAALIYFSWHPDALLLRRKAWGMLQFVAISVVPLLSWLVLNAAIRGESTNRTLEYHPIGGAHFERIWGVFSSWFKVPGPGVLTILVMLYISAVVFKSAATLEVGDRRKALVVGLPLAALLYVVFLLISISFADAYTPLDQRILLPTWLLLAIAVCISLQASIKSCLGFGLLLSMIIAIFICYSLKTVNQIDYSVRYGLGYQTLDAAKSPLLAIVNKEFPHRKLYSNARDYIYLHTGREVGGLPAIYDATTRKLNPLFIHQMAKILEEIENQEAAIVYFKGFEFRQYYPTAEQLEIDFSLNSTQYVSDGVYFNQLVVNR